MDKEEIYSLLSEREIPYEVTEHKAVFNMEEMSQIPIPYPQADAKNIFVRDDKKQHYYLITVKGDKRVNLKKLRSEQKTRALSFASKEDLYALLRLTPGSVTPFGLLNDEKKKVEFFLDDYFDKESNLIGCHPNENTATVWLQTSDLVKLIAEHGNSVRFVSI